MQTGAVLSATGECMERSAVQHQGTLSARGNHLQASSRAASYPQSLPSLADSLSWFWWPSVSYLVQVIQGYRAGGLFQSAGGIQDAWVIWAVSIRNEPFKSDMQNCWETGQAPVKPCLLLILPHPRAGSASTGKCANSQESSWGREGRGCKNTKKEMRRRMMMMRRRNWFFLISSTGWPLSLSSMERWSFLSAPSKFLVRCTQRGFPRLWWVEGWTWTDVRTEAETRLLLSCFSTFPTQICLSHHLSLPSILTTDEKVFRTQGLYLVF